MRKSRHLLGCSRSTPRVATFCVQAELGPVSYQGDLQRVGEEMLPRRGGALRKLKLWQDGDDPWLEAALAGPAERCVVRWCMGHSRSGIRPGWSGEEIHHGCHQGL
jgi:hypothetical protein